MKKAAIFVLALAFVIGRPAPAPLTGQPVLVVGQPALARDLPFLHFLVRKQASAEKFEELINYRKSDVHARTPKGRTALHWAAKDHPDPRVVGLLIGSGADVNARDNKGFTPLHFASRSKNPAEIVPALLGGGADVRARANNGMTPLHVAVRNSHDPERFINTLVNAGAEVNAGNRSGQTPLHYIVFSKKPREAARALLGRGADIRIKDKFGKTVADYAEEKGLPADVIKMLR